ncbi:primosomal protein N' [Candidatus Kuenenbacteria bacterium CG11_big_fil_rev_8_21_14_0_20_37_9]|uniref:Primosomal protein N n=2 Tax=Candidatus Kueneniibacteriota TaxID=1752740 RepID=A0A2M6XS00_9BACT|nr:MAG: primosomal protein N' [Candidatus Kuenenbacteria bacterium CG1_02_38_13]PIR05461.1 MAG: primosomal protein N' [Candidatus Kuenenbacteria bacterium CG11_big_fil_rev_8_21_14_0_20_37_9]PIU10403.1 MAG: primosomal protein N' [Candidatus Kuenenbacteria bacterium CG08_land_8_20_14_0_20_37_23]
MLIDVIPTKKMPRQLSVLTYKVPADLAHKIKVGQLVKIPLRNSIAAGVVSKINLNSEKVNLNPQYLKSIIGLVSFEALFTENQIKLFLELAKYCFISASLFVRHNLPSDTKMREIKKQTDRGLKERLTDKKIKKIKLAYFWWKNYGERNKYYQRLAQKNKKQLLIIVPRVYQIYTMAENIRLQSRQYSQIHGKLKQPEKLKLWNECLSGNAKIFIGTRSAIFYPFTQLETIIIDEEDSINHKQYDMNPRYDVRLAAQKLVDIAGGKVVLSSQTPSMENYYKSQKHNLPRQGKEESISAKTQKNIIIQDLNNELTKKNYSFISEKLEVEIKKTIQNKKQTFLFINKKGESTNTICKDCHYTFICTECGMPLIKYKNDKLICYHCNNKNELPPFCPKCQGPNFKSSGLGIEKIEKNLKKILPDIKITKIDKTVQKLPIGSCESSVILGTEFALDKIDWQKTGLIAIINADQLWQHSEFNTNAIAYALLTKILTSTHENTKVIIQTFTPNNFIIKSIYQKNPKIFYSEELNLRKNFGYPPFVSLIKLSILNKSEKKAADNANKVYSKIKTILANNKKISLSSPMPITRKKIRGKYKFNIILKLEKLENFNSLVKYVPNDWLIDVDAKTLSD